MAFLSQCEFFDLSTLGLVQRLLLVTDGTLTDMLEVAFLEPISLTKLACHTSRALTGLRQLDLNIGDLTMRREILLCGSMTRRNYVYAESIVAVDRMHKDFRQALLESDRPIGRLWSEFKLETYKELIGMSRVPDCPGALHFLPSERQTLLMRSYRVITDQQPIMLISEYFPEAYESVTPRTEMSAVHQRDLRVKTHITL